MSTSVFEALGPSVQSSRTTLRASHAQVASKEIPFVDLQLSPFRQAAESHALASNPVPDLISDDLYQLLRAHDLINEKGIRDYIIRRVFRQLRDQNALKTTAALAKIQEIYPYLQIDTIRKIIYRIAPGSNRKMMI